MPEKTYIGHTRYSNGFLNATYTCQASSRKVAARIIGDVAGAIVDVGDISSVNTTRVVRIR